MNIRHSLLTICLLVSAAISAETLQRSFYFDFGSQETNRGELTTGEDGNGHYWNNIGNQDVNASHKPSQSPVYAIVDASNQATDLTVQLAGAQFTSNGMSGGGGLSNPDAALLGDLAVATATNDYLFATNNEHCTIVINGLDPYKGYQFKIFGSRKATDVRISDYTLRGAIAVQGSLQVAGEDLGGTGVNQNNSSVYQSPIMRSAADGTITLTVHRQYSGNSSSYWYYPINCMRMQEFTDLHNPDAEIFIDCGHDDGNNGETTLAPDANGVHWVNLHKNTTSAAAVELTYTNGFKVNNGANVTITSNFSRNGYKNGGNTAETYSPLLGVFGQKSVAGDYFFIDASSDASKTGAMKFNGLNKNKAYVFYVYGSRAYMGDNKQTVAHIEIAGQSTSAFNHHTGGNALSYSGSSKGWNEDAFSASEPVFPTADGSITLSLSSARGSYVHINAIRIEEHSDYAVPGASYEYGNGKGPCGIHLHADGEDVNYRVNDITDWSSNAIAGAICGYESLDNAFIGDLTSLTLTGADATCYQNGSSYHDETSFLLRYRVHKQDESAGEWQELRLNEKTGEVSNNVRFSSRNQSIDLLELTDGSFGPWVLEAEVDRKVYWNAGANSRNNTSGTHYKATFTIHTTQSVSISSYGYATFYSDKAYDVPEGVSAWIITGTVENNLIKQQIAHIPANTGVLLAGDQGTHSFVQQISEDSYSDNLLQGSISTETIDNDKVHYVLSLNSSNQIGFFWPFGTNEGKGGFTNQAGKAYIEIPAPASGAPSRGFMLNNPGVATDIVDVQTTPADGVWYDVLGRAVSRPSQSGVYVRQGEKVIIVK